MEGKVQKEDLGKTIFIYENDKGGGDTQNGLGLFDQNAKTDLVDLGEMMYYDKHFPLCFKKIAKDINVSFIRLKKILKDISRRDVAFYDETLRKVEVEESFDGEVEKEVALNDYLLAQSHVLNDQKNRGRYAKIAEELDNITQKCPNKSNRLDGDIRKLIYNLYEKSLMLPTIVFISTTGKLQLRWQTDDFTIFIEGDVRNRHIEGHLNFTKNHIGSVGLEIYNLDTIYLLLEQFGAYCF